MAPSREMQPPNLSFPAMAMENVRAVITPPPPGTDLTGKVAIVTGASSGLGLEASKQLLSLGLSTLIIAVRTVERGQTAAKSIQSVNPKAKIEVWQLEMESYESILSFAKRCDNELSRLDLVILNAGANEFKFNTVPATGHERVMQVNHYGTALLALLLCPILKAKSPAGIPGRITVVNSAMPKLAKQPDPKKKPYLAPFDKPESWSTSIPEHYNVSKLANQFFLVRLADYVSAEDVVINMVEPGLTKGTRLFDGAPLVFVVAMGIFKALTARTPVVGAQTYLDALLVKGKESHGCYIENCHIAPLAPKAYGPGSADLIEGIWQETLDDFKFPGVQDILASMRK